MPAPRTDRLAWAFWWLALGQALHSIEEMRAGLYDFFWTATGRLHELVPALSQVRMTAVDFATLNMGFIALLFGAVPFVGDRRPAALGLAWLAAAVEMLNGAGHLAGILVFSGYVPGAATAPVLLWTGFRLLSALRQNAREEAS